MLKILIILLTVWTAMYTHAQTTSEKLRFLDSLNKYRIQVGVRPMEYYFEADTLAKRRFETTSNHIDSMSYDIRDLPKTEFRANVHYRFSEDEEWFNEKIVPQDTTVTSIAECSGYLTISNYLGFSDNIANAMFLGWKKSEDHWNMMMDARLKYVAIYWSMTNNGFIPILIMLDKSLRDPDKIRYTKYTNIPR